MSRGRPREFDLDKALDAAMSLFCSMDTKAHRLPRYPRRWGSTCPAFTRHSEIRNRSSRRRSIGISRSRRRICPRVEGANRSALRSKAICRSNRPGDAAEAANGLHAGAGVDHGRAERCADSRRNGRTARDGGGSGPDAIRTGNKKLEICRNRPIRQSWLGCDHRPVGDFGASREAQHGKSFLTWRRWRCSDFPGRDRVAQLS